MTAEDHSNNEASHAPEPDAAKVELDKPEPVKADAEAGAAKAEAATPNFELLSDDGTPKAQAKPVESTKVEPTINAKPEAAKPEAAKPDAGKAEGADKAGKALATASAGPINPFLAAAADHKPEAIVPPRSIGARLLDYSAHAAIVVGLIGFAWTVSDHVVNRPAKSDAPVAAAAAAVPAAPAKLDQMAELELANQKMHDEIRALKASVDSLRIAARRDTTPEQVRMLSAGLDSMKNTIAAAKSDTNAQIGQLSGKVDRLQPGKFQQLAERVGRLERQSVDSTTTGSIGKPETVRNEARAEHVEVVKTAPKPPVKPQELASIDEPKSVADEPEKPAIISNWVVRDVYQGVALIEGRYGNTREVVPGTNIPGAGTVKAIERHGNGWTVTTTKGQLAFAGDQPQRDPRDYRRGPGGGYGRGGYGPYGGGY